jgi:hypothetical protein
MGERAVRLVRLAQQPSRVSEDVRAALASLGRGNTVVGGISLIGVRPFDDAHTVDAVVVLPRGILLIIGVDLPDPSMRLEAPLDSQWKADGWPLVVQGDDAINPATKALAFSELVAKRLTEAHPYAGAVSTVVAVGPFVDTVDQPPADLVGTVRVLHPTPTSMLAATVSLATRSRPRSADQARALLKTLAPDAAELSDEELVAEGFRPGGDEPTVIRENPLLATPLPSPVGQPASRQTQPQVKQQRAAVPVPARRPAPPPMPPPPPAPAPVPAPMTGPRPGKRPITVRWLPLGAIALLAVLLIAAIVVASSGDGQRQAAPVQTPTATQAPPASTSQLIQGFQFTSKAVGADQRCASDGFGDVQASLQRTSCHMVRRGSFVAAIDGRPAAATVAEVEFADGQQAAGFKAVADTPGGGGIIDIATETGKWPGEVPRFDDAAYSSSLDGTKVRLVQVVWLPGPSAPDDSGLTRGAKAALDLSLNT